MIVRLFGASGALLEETRADADESANSADMPVTFVFTSNAAAVRHEIVAGMPR